MTSSELACQSVLKTFGQEKNNSFTCSNAEHVYAGLCLRPTVTPAAECVELGKHVVDPVKTLLDTNIQEPIDGLPILWMLRQAPILNPNEIVTLSLPGSTLAFNSDMKNPVFKTTPAQMHWNLAASQPGKEILANFTNFKSCPGIIIARHVSANDWYWCTDVPLLTQWKQLDVLHNAIDVAVSPKWLAASFAINSQFLLRLYALPTLELSKEFNINNASPLLVDDDLGLVLTPEATSFASWSLPGRESARPTPKLDTLKNRPLNDRIEKFYYLPEIGPGIVAIRTLRDLMIFDLDKLVATPVGGWVQNPVLGLVKLDIKTNTDVIFFNSWWYWINSQNLIMALPYTEMSKAPSVININAFGLCVLLDEKKLPYGLGTIEPQGLQVYKSSGVNFARQSVYQNSDFLFIGHEQCRDLVLTSNGEVLSRLSPTQVDLENYTRTGDTYMLWDRSTDRDLGDPWPLLYDPVNVTHFIAPKSGRYFLSIGNMQMTLRLNVYNTPAFDVWCRSNDTGITTGSQCTARIRQYCKALGQQVDPRCACVNYDETLQHLFPNNTFSEADIAQIKALPIGCISGTCLDSYITDEQNWIKTQELSRCVHDVNICSVTLGQGSNKSRATITQNCGSQTTATKSCQTDTDCPIGMGCGAQGHCVLRCADNSRCLPGTECYHGFCLSSQEREAEKSKKLSSGTIVGICVGVIGLVLLSLLIALLARKSKSKR